MAELAGWAGRILVVDLTTGRKHHLDTMDYARDYVGGRGLAAALAWEMVHADLDALDPDNPLMFLNGPLAGTSAPSAGRLTICGVAPQGYPIQWFSRASMGGNVGHHLKYAGLDGVILTGRAPHPVVLWICDDEVELRPADDLWGLGIMATQTALQEQLGPKAQIATIGPAGENLSCIASIGTNEGAAAGQGGFGAVMGSKNLKAVAVYGTGRPRIAHREGFRTMGKAIAREQIADRRARGRRYPPHPGQYGSKPSPCSTGCIMGCRTHYQGVPGTLFPDREYAGIVQCTAGRFRGSEDRLWNLGFEAGFELNVTANDWGINHWDLMKGVFPWIALCHRAGMLDELDGVAVELDDSAFWYRVLEAIAAHSGPMSDIVADGGYQAIVRTGLLPEEARQLYTAWGYANHWDGRGPHGNRIMYPFWLAAAMNWMVETRDPMGSTHGYVQNMVAASPFNKGPLTWEQLQGIGQRVYGHPEAMDPLSDYESKAEAALWHAKRSMIKDSLPLCDRVFPRLFSAASEDGLPRADGVDGPDFEARLYALATGEEVDSAALERAAERALCLERAQAMRDLGRSRATDDAVLDFFVETEEEYENPLLDERKRAESGPLRQLASELYQLRGWDIETGNPTPEVFRDLGLGFVLDELTTREKPVPGHAGAES